MRRPIQRQINLGARVSLPIWAIAAITVGASGGAIAQDTVSEPAPTQAEASHAPRPTRTAQDGRRRAAAPSLHDLDARLAQYAVTRSRAQRACLRERERRIEAAARKLDAAPPDKARPLRVALDKEQHDRCLYSPEPDVSDDTPTPAGVVNQEAFGVACYRACARDDDEAISAEPTVRAGLSHLESRFLRCYEERLHYKKTLAGRMTFALFMASGKIDRIPRRRGHRRGRRAAALRHQRLPLSGLRRRRGRRDGSGLAHAHRQALNQRAQ